MEKGFKNGLKSIIHFFLESFLYSSKVILFLESNLMYIKFMHRLLANNSPAVVIVALIIFFLIVLLCILIPVLISVNRKRQIPVKKIVVDITGKRINDANDAIDYYLINYGKSTILTHIETINKWKKEKLNKVKGNSKKKVKLEKRWEKQEKELFIFDFVRVKTRYKQVNYQRRPYKIQELERRVISSPNTLLSRISFLEKTGHTVTYNQFNSLDQRKAMTKELREFVKKRDNYTCQICGKYMPDEVGLHIDHIIPVSKGGKSIPQNLRVLCSKCNGKKGAK